MFPVQSGCTLTTRSEAPPGSGLGSSGALDVALVAALTCSRGERLAEREIAEQGWYLETVEAKIPGGKQDQFAAALGGFQRLSFHDPDVGIEPITLDPVFAAALERQTVLCYTGRSRVSGATIARVMAAYERGDRQVTGALRAMRDLAEAMAQALRASDLGRAGALLRENWRHQQALDSEMCTPEMARLERRPIVPPLKALLSSDGGICPDDGTALLFDPWSPNQHHCSRCGKTWAGERHARHWARFQHLWLAERAAHLAALQALGSSDATGVRAAEILRAYARSYWQYPNRDNVLGPSRLFFSTYLESIWILNYLAAAMLLRESGHLDEATSRGVGQVADEAANLIGEFDEGFSNRQTWNDAALAAIAVWFEDDDLAKRAIEGETGLLAHLMRGFGRDGMWYEGENYHLFALRGLLTGAAWARAAGVDLGAEPALAARVRAALLAPALTALPDRTFPARRDSRFGVWLAQPMYLEWWEIGLATCGMRDAGTGMRDVASWLQALYRVPGVVPEVFDSYLHDAPVERIPHPASRISLSWWSLLEMLPELPSDAPPWVPGSALLDSQGLAVLRAGERYVSLECGPLGGGHGHPDRLHLTLHADGVHWLPDVGTGSYVARDLLWYRSTLAHNAPRLDGASRGGNAMCETFDAPGDWGWTRGRNGDVTRTVVAGPAYLLDIVELASREDHLLELPWHFQGRGDVVTRGRWEDAELQDEFTSRAQRFAPETKGPITLELAADSRPLTALFLLEGELLRAEGPGLPA